MQSIDQQAKTKLPKAAIAYLAIALVIMLGPLLGMLWYAENPELQTSELAAWPAAADENGSPNINYLPQAGDYFADHFAYRPEAITLHAQLQTATLGVSTTDQVIYGQDGWLFYGGTLNDFIGTDQPSQRSIFNQTHNLRLLQDYVEANGASFAVTIAPNKNSIISRQMPYWYIPAEQASQQALIDSLQSAGLNYVDLFSLYDGQNTGQAATNPSALPQWLTHDSHWTAAGAYAAYTKIMEQLRLDVPALKFTDAQATPITGHAGDIDALLYPTATTSEVDYSYPLPAYAFFSDDKTVEASSSATINPSGTGTLLMYRDSFANALIPFFSATFNKAYYSKYLPYNLVDLQNYQADVVLVEVAQRSTLNFSANPPALPGPVVLAEQMAAIEAEITKVGGSDPTSLSGSGLATTVNIQQDGDYMVVSGILGQEFADEQVLVFVRVLQPDGQIVTREAFLTTARVKPNSDQTSDYGYKIFLPYSPEQLRGGTLNVIIKTGDNFCLVGSDNYYGEK